MSSAAAQARGPCSAAAARSAGVAQAAGAGDRHLTRLGDRGSTEIHPGSPAVTSQRDVTSQSQTSDITPSHPRVTALGDDATEQAGLWGVPRGAVGAAARSQGRSTWLQGDSAQHLSQDAQTGAGRGDNGEGPQWGPQLHPRWVTAAPCPQRGHGEQSPGRQGRWHSHEPLPGEPSAGLAALLPNGQGDRGRGVLAGLCRVQGHPALAREGADSHGALEAGCRGKARPPWLPSAGIASAGAQPRSISQRAEQIAAGIYR